MIKRVILGLLLSTFAASADELRNAGILGNSGEQGSTLVRFGLPLNSGLGVAYDRFGTLWDRGGSGVLNRYAVDGRQLATYPIPVSPAPAMSDALALAGDDLILLLNGHFYTLSINAPAGTAPTPLNVDAKQMSLSAHDGWVAAVNELEVFLVNAKGEKRPVATLDSKEYFDIEIGPDGAIYLRVNHQKIQKFSADGSSEIIAAEMPGDRNMLVDGAWVGLRWAGTVRRSNLKFRPAPGVIIGGNSGSFLGHVDECNELNMGRGLAQLSPNLFALSGFRGILHLVEWRAAEKQFKLVRRIGALPQCPALGLDRDGRVWYNGATWHWNDSPDTPQRSGVPYPDAVFATTMMPDDSIVAYSRLWGNPILWTGKLTAETRGNQLDKNVMPLEGVVGIVATNLQDRLVLLVLTQDGRCRALFIDPSGTPQGVAGDVELKTTSPVKEWTSLATSGKDTLMAAADGFIIEFARDGSNWTETKRWNSWGAGGAEKFGEQIYLSVDDQKIWICDTNRQRVVCLDAVSRALIGTFGTLDKKGDDLKSLDHPKILSARGSRAIIFDAGSQRLVKLELITK